MNTHTTTPMSRAVRRVREIWAELDYAQRRLFEIRTGIDVRARRRPAKATIEELYAAEEVATRARLSPHGR